MSTIKTQTPGPEDNPVAPDAPLPTGLDHGLRGLIRENLFKDTKNSILTIVFGLILGYVLYRASIFVFFNEKVTPDGGMRNSWDIISSQLIRYMVGTQFDGTDIGYPMLWAAIYTIAFTLGFASGRMPGDTSPPMTTRTKLGIVAPPVLAMAVILSFTETITPTLLVIGLAVPFFVGQRIPALLPESVLHRRTLILAGLVLLAFLLETGFNPGNVDNFGGLLLTVNVAFISIAACFPLGVVLALTRRSSFPLLRPVAVLYIELIRGVPLITLLFMGEFALRFFFPSSFEPPASVIRAIIMFTLFSAAYVAEIVRGGLQSVPGGQTEAGQAVGLSPVTITRKIVLPQALRNSIPALVGQFIALLKDTTLLIIISQFDLLGVSDPILASPEFQNQGYAPEVYAFVAFIFWVMCFSMSRASQRLETKLGVGTR
ncbi:amino acid ABC transporter permease [Euzebya rosea]|uniref:amino acid ABC transporter permease n=1 Tax=Euzebya rosea TaxID=2052804 RepID=UPI000D3EB5B3|nr:amino acid ABC transporter permease [Euzebya rosea]